VAGFTPNNLEGIRNRIYAEADYAPAKSPEAQKRVDEFINRAYYRLLLDAPFLFFSDRYQLPLYPDVLPGDGDSLQMATGDAWVLRTTKVTSEVNTELNTDGLLSGRRIFLYHEGDQLWMERRIREVWKETIFVLTVPYEYYFITLDRPLPDEEVFSEWVIEMGAFHLPHTVVEVKALQDLQSGLTREIEVIPEGAAEDSAVEPSLAGRFTSSVSSYAYRREHKNLAAPTFEPVTDAPIAQGVPTYTWVGPEPGGDFEYCFTYVWGYQDLDFRMLGPETQDQAYIADDTRRRKPLLESPPSKVSPEVNNVVAVNQLPTPIGVTLTLPDIDFVLGFGDNSTRRYNRAGIKKRIYRRRISTSTAGGFGRNIETPDSFYLIAEVDGHIQTWVDDGSKTPDYSEPLQPVHGYQTLQFYPRPAEKRFIQMRAIRRPAPLEDDQSYPRIHEEALDALINRALVYLHKSRGDINAANMSLLQYNQDLETLSKRYGTMVPDKTPRRLSYARARKTKQGIARWMLTRTP